MFIRMTQTIGTADDCYLAGQVYEPSDAIAVSFVRNGAAVWTQQPPEIITQLLQRLDVGAGKTVLFLPFVGEFGHLVMTHLRIVHFSRAFRKIVCCRPGEQVLYPSADLFFTAWENPIPDEKRIATMRSQEFNWPEIRRVFPEAIPLKAGNLTPSQELHCIHAGSSIPFRPKLRGLYPDVVLGVRRRDFTPERNWPHWQQVADALTANGYTFAVTGDRATSSDLAAQKFHTGDFDTDAAVEALKNCRLYIGTDTGSSHLAAAVGAPMMIFRTNGGNSRDLIPQMEQRNPGRVSALPLSAWDRPCEVIGAALDALAAGGVAPAGKLATVDIYDAA